MTMDPRWLPIVREWLEDTGVPDRLIDRHAAKCAQRLQDVAEEFAADIDDAERAREEAARDAHWDRKIDEARGK